MTLIKSVLVFTILMLPVVGSAAETTREITVTGRSEVRVAPDGAVISFAIETMDEALDHSKQENDQIVRTALDAIQRLGINSDQVRTDFIRIAPVESKSRETKFLGYRVTNSVVVTLHNIDLLEDILSSVLEAGVNRVTSLEFTTSDFRQHRDKAMLMALDAAHEKAQLMAQQLGAGIGKPMSIQEGDVRRRPNVSNSMQSISSINTRTSGPFAPGHLSIPASVTVTFELIDQ